MKFFLQRYKESFASLRTEAGRMARLLRHTLRGRVMCVSLAVIATLGLYGRYVTGLKFFLILDDGRLIVHETYTNDAGQALLEAGIHISPNDFVALSDRSGQTPIEIVRTLRVTVCMDGESRDYTMLEGSVASALHRAGYQAKPLDIVEPPPETSLTQDMLITVTRMEVYTETIFAELPFEVRKEDNPYINYGTEVVIQEGVPGARAACYNVILHDGAEVSRELVWEEVTPPVTKVIQCGSGGTVTMRDGTTLRYLQKFEVSATAYTTERQTNKLNALGKIARVGTIAVDPKVIKLRSKVYVTAANGKWEYGIALCEDTGGVIKGNKIDIYFDTWDECVAFGRRQAYVYVLE